jgi:RNA polymerase sigma-70 factor (ECF subfamily)
LSIHKKDNGDNPGFKELFKNCFHEHYESLHRYACTVTKDSELAKDIVQAVFVNWWEKQKELKIEISVKSYLFRAVHNQALNHLRNIKSRKTYPVDFGNTQFDIPDQDTGNRSESMEMEMKLNNAIAELPPQCKLIFIKSRFEGKKYIQIAEELNLSIKTVEAQIGKALKILRGSLLNSNKISALLLVVFFAGI